MPSKYLVLSTFVMLGIGLFTPFSPLAGYFGFTGLSLAVLISIFGLIMTYLVLVEITKRWFYRRNEV